MHFSTIVAIFSIIAPAVMADCCNSHYWPDKHDDLCADGTSPTPCCGYGSCNIFCCNCDGGCRKSARMGATSIAGWKPEVGDTEAFSAANSDNSGNLTLPQYVKYMGASEDDKTYVDWFNKHDKNGDGMLTIDEIRLN